MTAAMLAARLRDLSGADEDWLARLAHPAAPAAMHQLLARCLDAPGAVEARLELVRSLTLEERDWLLLVLHQRSFGHDILAEVGCPSCGEANEIRFAARDAIATPRTVAWTRLQLPGGASAVVRSPTAGDHEYFTALGPLSRDEQQHEALARLVVFDDAASSLDDLDAEARQLLARAIDAASPDTTELDLRCHACGDGFQVPFDPGSFVLEEVNAHARTLLDDVHTLALAYHWSEDDIFRLPIDRRLAYLSRIDAERGGLIVREERA
jgi:hypothetical protein